MDEEMRAGEVQNLNDLKEQKQEILNVIRRGEEVIADLKKRVNALGTKNQEDTKQSIDELKAQIQANETQLKANEEEIARLNKVISETSAKLASFSKEVKAQATP